MDTFTTSNLVKTACGEIEGTLHDDLLIFQGVPYAQPPVGTLRFKPPLPLQPWPGRRKATESAAASYQPVQANFEAVQKIKKAIDPGVLGAPMYPASADSTYSPPAVSEDCLYLQIWAPVRRTAAKLPVFLYFHGGANQFNAGSFNLERGDRFAREENIIVVRPNYRLGALGWVHFGLIAEDLSEAVNLGLQDQVAALRWVHANIEAFGGDPENITIGGESCGATAVSHLLTNAAVQPYFARAIMQSLSPFNVWCTQQPEEAVTVAQLYLDLLEIKDPAELLTIDPDKLLAVATLLTEYFPLDKNLAWRPLGGVIDGTWIPAAPAQYLAAAPHLRKDLQVMIGCAKDEWMTFRGGTETVKHGSERDVLAVLAQVFGERAQAVFDGYRTLYPWHAPGRLLSDIMSFEFFILVTNCFANRERKI